eukprot:CAMPEP_0168442638 /NCGR_PEP_ID=MMETSP0228-20121227/44115_1 /TAXON_ID=133427 /ORGANISM="Protoceratium reticulatum, Strain CCCM 535 (=CCMP 1889)" /LENGTH=412 /DNA_ID=CAMNT_0008457013 /DNA_START=38 /DNA_END=1276 /DNA_ORIENTATION=+
MSVNQEFWIVAGGCSRDQSGEVPQNERDNMLSELKRVSALSSRAPSDERGPWKFAVPDGKQSLIFGSFDNLIRLTDELQKCDSQVDSLLHRFERQQLELDPRAEFKVRSQRQERTLTEYLKTWQWDEAKFAKTRSISDNLALLMGAVNKLDEEARNKTATYNEYKTQKGNLAKKEGANLTTRDLVDVLTPDVVKQNGTADDDFIQTEYLTTVPLVLPRGGEVEFLKLYDSMHEKVVPGSAKKFEGLDDKDGNSVWRVVMFKRAAESFKKQCRERRFLVRDFEYSAEGYKKLQTQREQIDEAVKRQHELVRSLYSAAWSDTMVAWVHIKAMRVFVEGVLRFGMPPAFASFIVSPKPGAAGSVRKSLAAILGKQGQAGPCGGDKMAAATEEEGEEYYPYISLSFTPFTINREKA